MRHPRLRQWEDKLRSLLNQIDVELEQEYGDAFPLHPSRPPHGATHDPKYSGLFQVGASFSAGFGSRQGRGYVIQLHMATLSSVPETYRAAIEAHIADKLRQRLPQAFPGRVLRVEQDGNRYKIIGDLSLGSA